ncbi:hypothetical protein PG996_011526 [Apiospora saccharicola]|uniref:Lysine-specific metallo-endopeptidase domain-containing protein n=1 Tax=Apiospora saccharicola TaxID=335842 RepID=A0ABR1UI90_9PEZI
MRPQSLLLLALPGLSAAARYVVDISCRPDDEFFNSLKRGVQEGIHLAENAFSVMTDHADDQWVRKMAQYVLGTEDYEAKFNAAKITFSRVAAYEKEPPDVKPLKAEWNPRINMNVLPDKDWQGARSNLDVELYCSDWHFEKEPYWKEISTARPYTGKDGETAKQCYRTDFVMGSGEKMPKSSTMRSSLYDLTAHTAALETNPNARKSDFIRPKVHTANIMDICLWFTEDTKRQGWPVVDARRVEESKTDQFRDNLQHGLTPIDGIKTFGVNMLHELTHTNQGGVLVDIGDDCYGWRCAGALKTERNADSIAMLGLAMKLWSMEYYVEDDGTIHPF